MARSTVALALLGLLACAAFAMADNAEMQKVSTGAAESSKRTAVTALSVLARWPAAAVALQVVETCIDDLLILIALHFHAQSGHRSCISVFRIRRLY
jgi:hypothetical protein